MQTVLVKNGISITINITPTKRQTSYIARTIQLLDDEFKTVKYTHVYFDHVSTKVVNLDSRYDYYNSFFATSLDE